MHYYAVMKYKSYKSYKYKLISSTKIQAHVYFITMDGS